MVRLPPKLLFVGSFPPRECGIATFTKDIVDNYDARPGSRIDVIAVGDLDGRRYAYRPQVRAELAAHKHASYYATANLINAHPCAIVNVQHEYGLFGGAHVESCTDLLEACAKPVVLTLHTVLPAPEEGH